MSQVEDTIREYNLRSKQDNCNAALEEMAEKEAKRIAAEEGMQHSVKANWERLRLKRKPKVLGGLLPIQF